MIYEERYILFIDILGFGELIQKSVTDVEVQKFIHDILTSNIGDSMKNYIANEKGLVGVVANDFKVTSFSDSIVVSIKADTNQLNFIFYIMHLVTMLMEIGIFLRGGVSKGMLFHSDNTVFGPALNKAYELESTKSKYPRVIIDPEIDFVNDMPVVLALPNNKPITYFRCTVNGKNDKYHYLNIFDFASSKMVLEQAYNSYCAKNDIKNIQLRPYYWQNWPTKVLEHIAKNIDSHRENKHILEKYEWLEVDYKYNYSPK